RGKHEVANELFAQVPHDAVDGAGALGLLDQAGELARPLPHVGGETHHPGGIFLAQPGNDRRRVESTRVREYHQRPHGALPVDLCRRMHKHTSARGSVNARSPSSGLLRFGRFFRASMNRRDLLRSLATAIAIPAISGLPADPSFALGRRAHRRARAGGLQVLDPAEGETVATIAEMIIPATDTPGARAAEVHRFIDLLLAEWAADDERAKFLQGLADIDARARGAFGTDFLTATEAQRVTLLT